MTLVNIDAAQKKLKGVMKNIGLKNERIEKITKVTFESADGKTFVVHNARVWKLDLAGNLAYQVRGDLLIDLTEYFS